jgi:hypothetical protein
MMLLSITYAANTRIVIVQDLEDRQYPAVFNARLGTCIDDFDTYSVILTISPGATSRTSDENLDR